MSRRQLWVYSKIPRDIENLTGISLSLEQLSCSTDRQTRVVAGGVEMQEDARAFDFDCKKML